MSTNLNYIVFRFRNTESNAVTCFISISHDCIVAAVESIGGRKHPNKEILENLITFSKISELNSSILLACMFYNLECPPWLWDIPENIVRYKKEWILKNKREELELIYYREV